MNNVDYGVLKSNIIKCLKQCKEYSLDFKVNFDKLTSLVANINLVPIAPIGENAVRVTPFDIPYLSEYFEKTRLSWFTDGKFRTVVTFIDSEYVDETATRLLAKLKQPDTEDPDFDKVKAVAKLVAEYPCYFATIISYQNNDPNRIGKANFVIACRANKVVIKNSDYQYDPHDFS